MYYSDEIIEEVRSKNDIVDVISGYVKLKKQGSSYFGLCPFHSEKSPSFSVSRDKQMYYCFGCGAGGNVFTFIMEYENYSFVEALKFLAQRAGVELPQEEYSKEAKERADTRSALLEMNKLAAKYYYAQLTVLQIFSCLPSALRLQLRIIILGRQLVHLKQRTSRICSFFRFF